MPSNLSSHIPILQKDLEVQRKSAGGLLTNVDWTPKAQIVPDGSGDRPTPGALTWRSAVGTASKPEQLSLIKIAQALGKDQVLLSAAANFVLLTLQEAISIGFHLGQQYCKASGVFELQDRNKSGQLTQAERAEFQAKQNTAGAVTIFSASAYLVWRLRSYEEDKVAGVSVEFHGIPEVNLNNAITATKCFLYYLAAYSDPTKTRLVQTDLAMVKMAIRYGEATMEEIRTRVSSLKYVEPFTTVSYQLDGTDFVVSGFDVLRHTVATSVEFKRLGFDEIVGNRGAKHAARRLASRLACYDLKKKRNPFLDLGGMQSILMGFGKPGTGKSMMISAMATEIDELCKRVGVPFLFWPMPETLISTFQGGSGERMWDWMRRLQDDDKIVFAPIDDGENNLEDRTRQGISAGVREVIGVFLRGTEGAAAIWRGNAVIPIFTNLPEQIDPAVLSRVQARFPIDGAVTRNDFIDQDHLWWRKLKGIDPSFVNMADPRDYEYLSDQALLHSMAEAGKAVDQLEDEILREVYQKVRERHDITEHAFYGALFAEMVKAFPGFSSRDVRNIQQAVQARVIDFDLPEEWLEHPDRFYHQDYDRKVGMLKELMRGNMAGLSFADIRHEETLRYLDAMSRIANAGRERRIGQLIEAREIEQAALSRFAK